MRRFLARGKSETEVHQLVDTVDRERRDSIQKHFHVERTDRAVYHAPINTATGDDAVVHMNLDFIKAIDAVAAPAASCEEGIARVSGAVLNYCNCYSCVNAVRLSFRIPIVNS